MRAVYRLCSKVGSHFTEENVDKYTFAFLVNATLSILLWYGEWMDKKKDELKENI